MIYDPAQFDAHAAQAIAWRPEWLGANGAGDTTAPTPAQVATALRWILFGPPRPVSSSSASMSSYAMKHECEDWGRLMGFEPYVSNGALIAAALYLGVPVRRSTLTGSPNAFIGLKVDERKSELIKSIEHVPMPRPHLVPLSPALSMQGRPPR